MCSGFFVDKMNNAVINNVSLNFWGLVGIPKVAKNETFSAL